MKNTFRHIVAVLGMAMLFLPQIGRAQFFTAGDDPFCRRWYSIESENYRVIYPQGLDSLARVYAREMERYRKPVGLTSGYLPGECTRGKMPVVLHAYNSVSNGSVAWAPKRMDAYTLPQIYGGEAQPWVTQLAVHESRHISQMQFGLSNAMRPFNWFFGEMWNGLTAGIYTDISMLEGDAVIAETELTRSGRGRKADFLNYYMVCFDQGDLRDYDQWRYGSQKNYTPDHYAIGYLSYGGMRWLHDRDDYTANYLDYVSRRPWLFTIRETASIQTAGKDFVKAFPAIRDSVTAVWRADAEKRRPYMDMEQITPTPSKPVDYEEILIIGDELFAVKHGFNHNYSLVKIELPDPTDEDSKDKDDDRFSEEFITHFGSYTGTLNHSPLTGRIYWSESVPDARWTLKYTSEIRDMQSDGKKKRTLSRKGYLYNPVPSENSPLLAAVESRPEGGSRLVLIDAETGTRKTSFDAPDSLQLVEAAWIGDDVYVSGVSENGFGIYRLERKTADRTKPGTGTSGRDAGACSGDVEETYIWTEMLEPQPVQIKNFHSQHIFGDVKLLFTCDRTGVNELYCLSTADRSLHQITSSRYGASDYQFDATGGWLYFSSQTIRGKMIFRTPSYALFNRVVDWRERYSWHIADKLSEQARHRAEKLYGNPDLLAAEAARADTMSLSAPRRYRKFPQMFRVHSWAPVYANIPVLMNDDLGDNIFDYVNLGATAVLQNQLGTFSGIVGYSAHKDSYDRSRWRHSAHLNLKYTGLYPVLEFNLDFNDRAALQNSVVLREMSGGYSVTTRSEAVPSVPNVTGSLSAYIPFRFSSGGWSRGFTPRVTYSLSNDRRDANAWIFRQTGLPTEGAASSDASVQVTSVPDGFTAQWVFDRKMYSQKNLPAQSLTASASLYGMLPVTNSAVYPRWGGGLQAGVGVPLGMTHWYSPAAFAYGYGYFPGFTREQGLKLTGLWQGQIPSVEKGKAYRSAPFHTNAATVLPRGFTEGAVRNALVQKTDRLVKLTADYAVPIYVGDRSLLWSCIYVKRLQLNPHFDCTLFSNSALGLGQGTGALMTYGFDLAVDVECLLWLVIPCTLGISVNFNGAPGWNGLSQVGSALGIPNLPKFYIGPVISLSMF